jgi:hypothetical protein
MHPMWPPLCVGGLHLGSAVLARTQRRFDYRLLNACALFLLAIVMRALYEDATHAAWRPLLQILGLHMLLPAVSAIALDIAQHVCIRPQCSRNPLGLLLQEEPLAPSLSRLHAAVHAQLLLP